MKKTIVLLSFLVFILASSSCALFGGGRYRAFRNLQGEWRIDEGWTAERVEAYVKKTWGSPKRNQRALKEFNDLMAQSRQVSFIFNGKQLTVRSGKREATTRWSVMHWDSATKSAVIRKWGESKRDERLNRHLSLQELVDVLGVRDGDLPHVLGVNFLDNGRVDFFTVKVVAGRVTHYRASNSLQIYKRGPIPEPTATPVPTPTPTPVPPRPTPVPTPAPLVPTPIPKVAVPPMVPLMALPTPVPGGVAP